MHQAIEYVQQNFGKEDAAAYISVLFYLDLQTSEHPIINRCDKTWLDGLLADPNCSAAAEGFSLFTGPQCGIALFHSLKFIGRLFIYKTVLWNKDRRMRLPADIVAEIDAAVLRIYGGQTRTSHLNFVYGHHVEWVFRNVAVTFARCPEPWQCIGHMIAALHSHYGHMKPRISGDTRDIFRADVCSDDLHHLSELFGLTFILPLMGQLIGSWNMATLYHVGMRRAVFMEAEQATAALEAAAVAATIAPAASAVATAAAPTGYATADPTWHPPMALSFASDYTVEKGHQVAKAGLKNTSAKIANQRYVMQCKFQQLRDQSTHGSKGSSNYSGPKCEQADTVGMFACPCVIFGLDRAKPGVAADDLTHHDGELPSFLGGTEQEDDAEEETDDGDSAAAGPSSLKPQEEVISNLRVVVSKVAGLSAHAASKLYWTHLHYHLFGQPVGAVNLLCELAPRAHRGSSLQDVAGAMSSALKPGMYAVSLSLTPRMDWANCIAIEIVAPTTDNLRMRRCAR